MIERFVRVPQPFDLVGTTRALGCGSIGSDGSWWWATRCPSGEATISIGRSGEGVDARCWGAGAEELIERVPRLLGVDDVDRPEAVDVRSERLIRASASVRLGSTGDVHGALVVGILGQVVTRHEAKRSLRGLVAQLGEVAPGPDTAVRLLPAPGALANVGYERFHDLGIERRRASVLIEVSRRIARLEEILDLPVDGASARLTSVRGVGPWTAAHVMGVAWGDRDAVPIGDYHLPNTVAWALAGEERANDDRMLELLEPFRPFRRRLVVAIKQSGIHAPRRGPKTPTRMHL